MLFLVFVGSYAGVEGQTPVAGRTTARRAVKAERFLRTELYFGRLKPGGRLVSDEEWNSFLADAVTPRFPEGFTVLPAFGQYREKSGRIISEPSQVLIFLYPGSAKKESRAKIEEIRTAYIERFAQESVLRMDLLKRVSVSF